MSQQQKFYNNNLYAWFITLPIFCLFLYFTVRVWMIDDRPTVTIGCYLLPLFTMMAFFMTLYGFITWRSRHLAVSDEGIILYSRLNNQQLITWDSIQSIEYCIDSGVLKTLRMHTPIGERFEVAKITYYDHKKHVKERSIVLSTFRKYSGRYVFDKLSNTIKSKVIDSPLLAASGPSLLPDIGEVIVYEEAFRSTLYLIGGFVSGGLLFILGLLIGSTWFLMLFVAMLALSPFLLYQIFITKRNIALVVTEQGIQDEWLYQRNAFIPWAEIKAIEMQECQMLAQQKTIKVLTVKSEMKGERYLIVELKHDAIYVNACSQWQKLLLKIGKPKISPMFFMTQNISNYSLDIIQQLLVAEWKKHRKGV